MSIEECRALAETCDRMAESLGPNNAVLRETMREVAAQWRRLADDAETRATNPFNLHPAASAGPRPSNQS